MPQTSAIDPKKRFSFGKNWSLFLKNLTEEQIVEAEKSLKEKLKLETLEGKSFLDIGCGSGLFSLAAHRLGAKVFSIDYDNECVNCAKFLKSQYAPDSIKWHIEQGSVLDQAFLDKFKGVDILYSWGVLHHTGHMYDAFENVSSLVKKEGKLFISIYNDQGKISKIWTKIKKTYVNVPLTRPFLLMICGLWTWKYRIAWGLVRYGNPMKYINEYGKNSRGMSAWRDVVDWVGGYPFEVAKPEEVFNFFKNKNFDLCALKTCGKGLGCNEFVFQKG